MAEHSALPWTWHAKSVDQAHNGSIYRMGRPGHAYAIAMQPRYVSDAQFAVDAAFIVKAVNAHDALVKALEEEREYWAGESTSTMLLGLPDNGTIQDRIDRISRVLADVGPTGDRS